MKTCTRSQQSKETKVIIRNAKMMVDQNKPRKEVFDFIRTSYNALAEQYGFFDNVQYDKAIKSIVDYMD
jgi:hypothetical protein